MRDAQQAMLRRLLLLAALLHSGACTPNEVTGATDASTSDAADSADAPTPLDGAAFRDASSDSGRPDGTPDYSQEVSKFGPDPRSIYLYRTYRDDYGAGRSSSYISPGTTNLTMTPEKNVNLHERGDQLSQLWTSTFASTAEQKDVAIENLQHFQSGVGWTIEVWFRASNVSGTRPLFSDGDQDNYALLIRDGRLEGRARTATGAVLDVRDANKLSETWHHAALVARVNEFGRIHLRLYRDQEFVNEAIGEGTNLHEGEEQPTIGSMAGAHFDGEVHAVEMHNWPLHHQTLTTPQLRDGSRMLGRPSYHNYLDGSAGYALRLERTRNTFARLAAAKRVMTVPLLNDGFVPQGLALSENGELLYLGYYHRLPGNDRCSIDQSDSVIAEVDLSSQTVTRIFRLVGQMHHVGGLAVYGNNLYVADSRAGELERYSLSTTARHTEEFVGAPVRFSPPVIRIRPEETMSIPVTASTLDFDPMLRGLWVGEHRPSNSDAVRSGRLRLFGLKEDGTFDGERAEHRYCLPVVRLQGLAAYHVEGDLHFVLSRSYGHNPSYVYDWEPTAPSDASCSDNDIRDLPVMLELPAGLEEVDLAPDGSLWGWSESGASYYQKRDHESCSAAWSTLAPFVMAFERD